MVLNYSLTLWLLAKHTEQKYFLKNVLYKYFCRMSATVWMSMLITLRTHFPSLKFANTPRFDQKEHTTSHLWSSVQCVMLWYLFSACISIWEGKWGLWDVIVQAANKQTIRWLKIAFLLFIFAQFLYFCKYADVHVCVSSITCVVAHVSLGVQPYTVHGRQHKSVRVRTCLCLMLSPLPPL